MTTWRVLIDEEMAEHGESWDDVVHVALGRMERRAWMSCEPPTPSLDTVFDDGYGIPEGCPFTLWTHKRVYFPVCHDGAESVGSVPRNPCDQATDHVGGG